MPIVKTRDLVNEIRAAGCMIERTKKGHYLVLDPAGNPISGFATLHPGNEVIPKYVSKVRNAIKKVTEK
jgi:hypothetical protein